MSISRLACCFPICKYANSYSRKTTYRTHFNKVVTFEQGAICPKKATVIFISSLGRTEKVRVVVEVSLFEL